MSAPALAQTAENSSASPRTVEHVNYRPGFVWGKVIMLAYSLAMVATGLVELMPDLALIATGRSVQAEATAVIKERYPSDGREPLVLRSPTAVKAAEEKRDRSYIFWNEYRFYLPDGTPHTVRAPFASQLKPQKPLFDTQGIPSSAWVIHDRSDPSRVVLPAEFSTWYLPGMLIGFGLAGTCVAVLLLRSARKPVQMPVLGPPSNSPIAADPGA